MSFLEWILSHMEYMNIGSFFGLGRTILWQIVKLLASVSNAIETLYNNVFSVAKVIYNDSVVSFIQTWLNYLYIPILISLVILGYNLIMGNDEVDTQKQAKKFATNVIALVCIITFVPMLFLGYSTERQSTIFSKSVGTGHQSNYEYPGGGSGVLSWFTQYNSQGGKNSIISAMNDVAGLSNSSTYADQIIANNTYDLEYIYEQVANKVKNGSFSTGTNFETLLESGSIRKNRYVKSNGTNSTQTVNSSAITSLNYNETTETDALVNGKLSAPEISASSLVRSGRDVVYIPEKGKYDGYVSYDKQIAENNVPTSELGDADGQEYIFMIRHTVTTVKYSNGTRAYISNDGATKNEGILGGWFLFSNYPFRYSFEWGLMILSLITSCAVLFLTSYKIVRIIYEITVNQVFLFMFAPADLNSGQKTKEILKSIISLIVSAVFAVVLVVFYYILCNAVNDMSFTSNSSNDAWIKCFVNAFIGIAAIKGPSVLEKVLGVEGGLGGSLRDLSTAARTAGSFGRAAAKTAKAAGKVVKGAATVGAAGAIYGMSRHKGKKEAKADREKNRKAEGASKNEEKRVDKTNRNSIDGKTASGTRGTGSTARMKQDGDTSQFEAADSNRGRGSHATMETQSDAIKDELSTINGNADQVERGRAEVSEKYKGNIQNAAMSEQAKDPNLSDKEALQRSYENSGFTVDEARKLASRDITDGSFETKKTDFENSISKSAQDRYQANPLKYNNQSEAYIESAKDHYQSLGLDAEKVDRLGKQTGNKVCVADNQQTIRNEAKRIQANETKEETVFDGKGNQTGVKERRYTDEEAVQEAITRKTGAAYDQLGYRPNSEAEAKEMSKEILKSGTLNEGVARGRVADNIRDDSRTPNTHSGSLGGGGGIYDGINPATYALFGFRGAMGERVFKNSGYKAGYKKEVKKTRGRK